MGMPLAAVDALQDLMPAADFVDGSSAMWAVRSTKSTSEIARLRGACLANAAGFRAGFEAPALGMREDEIANRILVGALGSEVAETACVEVGWIAATSGPSGYDRFVAAPRPRRLESGDMLWADLGMTVDGYWSDYCRAAVIGGPTQRQSDRQARIGEATAAGVAMARPGVAVADIARAVRAAMSRLGLPELAFGRVGHGIGVNATEPPSIVEDDRTVLEAGMVITIEPAATLDDGLYCAEQVVVVGDTPEVISPSPVELSHI
jgi:Xaa-Pro aminopeptidase